MNPHTADKRIGSRFVRRTSRLEFRSRNEEHSLEKLSGVPRWRCRAGSVGGAGLEVVDGWLEVFWSSGGASQQLTTNKQ